MRKIRMGVCVLALALAGCTTGGDGQLSEPAFTEIATDVPGESSPNEDVTPAAGSPRAFVFESGVLEFGDFDPYALGDDLFNPCTEITEAEYAEAGFERLPEFDIAGSHNELSFCQVKSSSDVVTTGFSNGSLNERMLRESGVVYDHYRSELIPEMIVFGPDHGREGDCYTQIDTVRGGLGASVGGSPNRMSQDEICSIAISMTEKFVNSLGTSGTVH